MNKFPQKFLSEEQILDYIKEESDRASNAEAAIQNNLNIHSWGTNNPHNVTAEQVGAARANHTQSASSITAGIFDGVVKAKATSQPASYSVLRNSKLVPEETDPVNNGEICWTYE